MIGYPLTAVRRGRRPSLVGPSSFRWLVLNFNTSEHFSRDDDKVLRVLQELKALLEPWQLYL